MIGMTAAAAAVLARLAEFERDNDAGQQDRARKMLNLERETAEFLHLLVRATNRKQVLEIGTSNGVSAIWIASALQGSADAQPLVTIERDSGKQAQAAENIRLAGLREHVRLRLGDATEVAGSLLGPFDCVFFDADRVSAPGQLAILLPKLAPDCLLLADNALSHPGELAGYRAMIEQLPGFNSLLVPIGKGLHLAHRKA